MEEKKSTPDKGLVSLAMTMAGIALRPLERPAMIIVDAGEEIAVANVGELSPDNADGISWDFKVIAGFVSAHDAYTDEEQRAMFDIILAAMKRKCAAKMSARAMTETSDSATVESTETEKEAVHG